MKNRLKKLKAVNNDYNKSDPASISFIDWLHGNKISKIRYMKKSMDERVSLRREYEKYIENNLRRLQEYMQLISSNKTEQLGGNP